MLTGQVAAWSNITAYLSFGDMLWSSDHMDFTPLGDVVSTLISLIQGCPDVDFLFEHELPNGETVHLDTREMREALGDEIPLNSFEVLEWARGIWPRYSC